MSYHIALFTAFTAGFNGAHKAQGLHQNKFKCGSAEYTAWRDGWTSYYVE